MYTEEEIAELAKCIFMEARQQGSTGMHAVAHCAKNRIGAEGFPKTLIGVIYSRNAFSWTRPDNPEHNLDPALSIGLDQEMYLEALRLAAIVLNTDDPDPTGGAHFYENPKTAGQGWFQKHIVEDTVSHPFTVQIGLHRFYV